MVSRTELPKLITPDTERLIERIHARTAAEAREADRIASKVRALWGSGGGRWFRRFVDTRQAETTRRAYKAHIGDYFLWLARTTSLVDPFDASPEHLARYGQFVLDARSERSNQRYALRTRQERIRTIRSVYQFCADDGVIDRTPARHVRIPGRAEPHRTFLNEAQAAALLAACSGSRLVDLRDRSLVTVLLHSGLRAAEAAGLTWDQVWLTDAPRVRVEGKGHVVRTVPLSATARDELLSYAKTLDVDTTASGPVWIRINHRLSGEASHNLRRGEWAATYSALSTQSIRAIVIRRSRRAGLAHTTPHTLRRTYATKLRSLGITLDTIARYLGHASIQTTAAYFNPVDDVAMDLVLELDYGRAK